MYQSPWIRRKMQRQGSMTGASTMAATNNQAPPPSGSLIAPRGVPVRRDSLRAAEVDQKHNPVAALKRQGTIVHSLLDVAGARKLQSDVQQDAMLFAEYDMDGNQKLDVRGGRTLTLHYPLRRIRHRC